MSLASTNNTLRDQVQQLLQSSQCIFSLTDKTRDVEIFGIYKNIIAILCGVMDELQMGKNITSEFLTKCLEFIIQFYNLDYKSLLQPAGIGDLFLSCASPKSRNFTYGCQLVRDCNYTPTKLVEGLKSLHNLQQYRPNPLLLKLTTILQSLEKNNHKSCKENILSIIHPFQN